MTITGLSEFIRSLGVPKVGRSSTRDNDIAPLRLEMLRGKKVAIEVPGMIYKQNRAAIYAASRNFPFIFMDGIWTIPPESEILRMFKVMFRSMVRKISSTGIIPYFIFEGRSPEAKKGTREKRNASKDEALRSLEELRRVNNLIALQKELYKAYPPDGPHMEIAKEVVLEMGLQVVEASYEAEGVCASLVQKDICDLALIDDYDIFMYGCKAVIRNLWTNDKTLEVEGYALRDILIATQFQDPKVDGIDDEALERFRLLCILSGSDYAPNVYNMGIHRVYNLLTKNGLKSYDDVCRIDPRYKEIPYTKIIDTMHNNMLYTMV